MFNTERFFAQVHQISSEEDFANLAITLFKYQAKCNEVYSEYISHLGIHIDSVEETVDIPFLPIELYKTHTVKTGSWNSQISFKSSGTTGQQQSVSHVRYAKEYLINTRRVFEQFYGDISKHTFLALLPSYLERGNSSLVYMVADLIKEANDPVSGFFLQDHDKLVKSVQVAREYKKRVIIFGVTFALLDLAEHYHMPMDEVIIVETGGMKGRGTEPTRETVHKMLQSSFPGVSVHSEYGMTELMSQAYALERGVFQTPPWMRIQIRDVTDPFCRIEDGSVGALNIIDLANIHTCAFVETADLGKKYQDNSFEVLGRMDNSEIRGCNILVS